MFYKLSSAEKKVLLVWGIIGILLFSITILFKVFYKNDDIKDYSKNVYSVERDAVRYYTVNGALTKYYAFLNARNESSIFHILDDRYKKAQGITKENISSKIAFPEHQRNFQSNLMCSKEIGSGIVSYYVSGYEVSSNIASKKEQKYYEVILDGNQFVFSVSILTSDAFEGVCHGRS